MDLEDELLTALKERARKRGVTLGQIISELTRRSLAATGAPKMRNGVRLFTSKPRNRSPDLQLVNTLRD